MKDLCVPVPHFEERENAEIILKVGQEKINFNFRVVSFPWEVEDEFSNGTDEISRSLARITRLKKAINSYDKDWELIQIYTPLEEAKFIQVLYRQKRKA